MTTSAPHRSVQAVVLAGGTSQRWDGQDKTQLVVAGRSLLDHALTALPDDADVVVVGPPRPTSRPVGWTREEPAGSGPAAGVQAGLRALRPGAPVVVLAADLPRAADLVDALLDAPRPSGALVLADGTGRAHWTSALLSADAADVVRGLPDLVDVSLRRLFDHLDVTLVPAPDGATHDLDSPADLDALQEDH
ncbi:MAG: NTP transferase domain-containing protein [Propionibacteriales bacterium]|nr:NTP transferase domain-containing protein [Propionibacteriales bacterium]